MGESAASLEVKDNVVSLRVENWFSTVQLKDYKAQHVQALIERYSTRQILKKTLRCKKGDKLYASLKGDKLYVLGSRDVDWCINMMMMMRLGISFLNIV